MTDQSEVLDQSIEKDESHIEEPSVRFNLSSYGWDSDVEGLVQRLKRGDIYVPHFQRKFVWSPAEKSRFIESLILGLPVPSLFLARDPETNKLSIIDGQQRLRTLLQFYNQEFPLRAPDIQDTFSGRYCFPEEDKKSKKKSLKNSERRFLLDSVIHSVVLREEIQGKNNKTSPDYYEALVQLFKRLNTTGKPLQAQEVRACIFFGPFNDLLRNLNTLPIWRKCFGPEHIRMRDEEIILRFLALYYAQKEYKAPMKTFLDKYMRENRFIDQAKQKEKSTIFEQAITLAVECLGPDVFKTGGTFLLSRFDAVMVGLARNLATNKKFDKNQLQNQFKKLLKDGGKKEGYIWATTEFINDKERIDSRIERAISILGE